MPEELDLPEDTITEIVDHCTLAEVRDLAIAALTAYAEDTVHWDEAIDARMAMTDTLNSALPDRVRAAEAAATSNQPELDYVHETDYGRINLWRPYLGLGRVNEEGVEMTREDVVVPWGTETVGVRPMQTDEGLTAWMVAKWSDGDLLGYIVPVVQEGTHDIYAAVLHVPYEVARAIRAKDEDFDLDEAMSLDRAQERVREHPLEQFKHGARHECLANIVTESIDRKSVV